MLSSMVQTRLTLETSASSQLSASEKLSASKCIPGAGQFFLLKADGHQRRRNGECVFDAGRLQPLGHGLFGIGLLERAQCGGVAAAQRLLQQAAHAVKLDAGFGLGAGAQAELLQAQQILAQLRGGALGRRTGVVQLMHQSRRQRSQRDQLLAVQRLHLVGLQPLRHVGQHHLARRRAAGHQRPELLLA